MTDITIPPAALEAGARAIGEETYVGNKQTLRDAARAAFLAMIEAWPEAKRVKGYFTHDTDYYEPAFILPLTEKTDG